MIGQTLGHYQIIAKIGAGGMGEVYRAHDEQLDRDVALKVLPAGTLADEGARKQFRKEALALAKLNHPNIETVFEFSTQDSVDFLAMELIPGISVSEKLKQGPLSEKEIVHLGMQFAEGLAAAHEQGVVHRDLKPGNLMVTPDGRLKILDFGLAKLLNPTPDLAVTQSVTCRTGTISGTVPYMSPEQLRGLPVDARSDIYAAGAVLYEMATGQRPFPQTHGPTLMGAILHEAPASPSSTNPHVTPGLESMILKALEKEPQRRYQSARELQAALEGLPVGLALPTVRPRRSMFVTAGTSLTLALLAGLIFGLNLGGLRDRLFHSNGSGEGSSAPVGSAPIRARRSVAVLGFKNLSGQPDKAWLSTALSEMLTTELAAGEKLRTVPGENVAQMKISLSLPDADSFSKETLTKIRQNLGTDDVVLGSYILLGKGQIRLDLRLQDAAAGETLAAVSEKGTEAQLDDLVSRTGAILREKLGAGGVSAVEAATVKASLPSNPEAARLYSEGLAKLRTFDNLGARDLLEKAVAVDPKNALAHSALAAAWSGLGYDAKAREEAKEAVDLSGPLSREERLWVEGQYRQTSNQWDKAVEIYRTLWGFFPDNLEYGLRLAAVQTSAGKAQETLATVEALRKLPLPVSDDPRIDLAEAAAAGSVSNYNQQQVAAAKAVLKGTAHGARLLAARGRLSEGSSLARLGERKKATTAFEDATRIYASAGDRGGVADSLHGIGFALYLQGDLARAKKMYEKSLAIKREISDKRGMAGSLNNIGAVLYQQGDFAGAKKIYEESLVIEREISDKRGMAGSLNNIGAVLYQQGDLAGAKKMYEETLAIEREIGERYGAAAALHNIAGVLHNQGDLAGAKKIYEEALMTRREIGDKSEVASTLHDIAEVLYIQADLAGARKMFEESLANHNELGEKVAAAEDRLAIAIVSVEEGHAAEAEVIAREAADVFRAGKRSDNEMRARAVLAEVLLAQGRPAEAQDELNSAEALVMKSQKRQWRLKYAIAAARVRAAMGKTAEATRSLEATLAEATKHGFTERQFEARLALGEIEIESGKTAAGHARLAALEKDATAKGFILFVRKAAATRQ